MSLTPSVQKTIFQSIIIPKMKTLKTYGLESMRSLSQIIYGKENIGILQVNRTKPLIL